MLATTAQWALDASAPLSPALAATSSAVAGGVLVAAGIYQFAPLKATCLKNCRTPLDFLIGHWRSGPRGAFVMGLQHGLYCLGCCWMLMALLFVGGLMSLAWVGAIALFVLVEKTMPWGDWIGRLTGLLLVLWGTTILVRMI